VDNSEIVRRKTADLRHRYHAHQDAVGSVAEGRWYAHNFLLRMLADLKAPEALAEAARCYDEEHTLMWQLRSLVVGPGDSVKKAQLFADPAIRLRTAEFIPMAQEHDRRAADSIEGALAAW
jgi:hypothetical protein